MRLKLQTFGSSLLPEGCRNITLPVDYYDGQKWRLCANLQTVLAFTVGSNQLVWVGCVPGETQPSTMLIELFDCPKQHENIRDVVFDAIHAFVLDDSGNLWKRVKSTKNRWQQVATLIDCVCCSQRTLVISRHGILLFKRLCLDLDCSCDFTIGWEKIGCYSTSSNYSYSLKMSALVIPELLPQSLSVMLLEGSNLKSFGRNTFHQLLHQPTQLSEFQDVDAMKPLQIRAMDIGHHHSVLLCSLQTDDECPDAYVTGLFPIRQSNSVFPLDLDRLVGVGDEASIEKVDSGAHHICVSFRKLPFISWIGQEDEQQNLQLSGQLVDFACGQWSLHALVHE